MVIGFTQRMRTVSEGDVPVGGDILTIDIDVATLRPSEREHPMIFRVQLSASTAIVETGYSTNPLFDVIFGTRDTPDNPIQEEFNIEYLETNIPPLTAQIRDDLRPEDEECFIMRIFPVDVPGRKELFDCYEDYYNSDATSYFCETTICIEDDDGRSILYRCIIIKKNSDEIYNYFRTI